MPRIRKYHSLTPDPIRDRLAAKDLAPPPLLAWARWGERLGWLLLCPKRPAGGFLVGEKGDREASPRKEVVARLAQVADRLPFLREIELWHPRGGWMSVEAWRAPKG